MYKVKKSLDGPLKTVLLVIIMVVLCAVFSVYNLMGLASTLYNVCFEREESDKLLEQDDEWFGSEHEREARLAAAEAGRSALDAVGCVGGEYVTVSAGSKYLNAEKTLGYEYCRQGGDTAVILLHGYNRDKDFAEMYAEYWVGRGFDVAIPQLRGHSGDEGASSLGFYEQFDLFDLMTELSGAQGVSKFIIHGQGEGAVAALLLAGNDEYMKKMSDAGLEIRLIAAESAYTTMNEMIELQLPRQFEMSGFYYYWSMRTIIDKNLGFFSKEADALAAATRIGVPAVFICGENDGFVPASMTQRMYDACASDKEMLSVSGARFGCAWIEGNEEYTALLDRAAE